jgi:hypothetical protein
MIEGNVNHWSQSAAKLVYRNGIDYAVAERLKIVKQTFGKAVDIGQLAHAHLLGGEQEFVVKKYPNYLTKEAKEWRDAQTLPIISEEEFDTITTIVDRIKGHPLANELIFGKGTQREVELKAKIEGKDWVGRADVVKVGADKSIDYILDVKTAAKFDDFKWTAKRNDYDLQAAVYSLIAKAQDKPFYWVIVETVAPYRVGVAVAAPEFVESGYRKLETICNEIKKFDARDGKTDFEKLNFNLNNTMDDLLVIGDWSL